MRFLFCTPVLVSVVSVLSAGTAPDAWITAAGGKVTRDGKGRHEAMVCRAVR